MVPPGGSLYSVGDNYYGGLGLGSATGAGQATWGKVNANSAGWGNASITTIVAGDGYSLVVAGVCRAACVLCPILP